MPGRVPEGAVSPRPVAGVDLIPTIFSFAGLELPWPMHGEDLSPLLADPQRDWPHPVLLAATGRKYGSDTDTIPEGEGAFHNGIPWYVMLVDGRFKYVRPLIHDLEELYDLENDPDELDNLAVKPAYRQVLERLRESAVAELREDGAGFVDNMPPVREVR